MDIRFKTNKPIQFGKCQVRGYVIGKNSAGNQVQEVLETIYFIWKWRIIVKHDFKFAKY